MIEKFDWKKAISRNIFTLRIMGLWPTGDNYKKDVYSLYSFASILAFIYDLQAMSGTIFILLSELLAVVKSYYVIHNMKMLKQLMIDINNDIFQPRNPQQNKIITLSINIWRNICSLFWCMSFATILLRGIYPALDGGVKNNELPYLAWYPYDTKISPFYEITYVYQVTSVAYIAASVLSVDMLIAALNMFIGAQCDILCDDLRNMFNSDDLKIAYVAFLNCIKHHKAILKFANDANKFFNWIVFAQFFISAISVGLTMFLLTITVPFSSIFFSLATYGLAIVVQTFMYCWFGNEVEIKSSNIPSAIFESKWINANNEFKKSILYFIMRSQRPMKMSALNLIYLSVETFMRILRASWSYFALLNQVNTKPSI